jgi:hypothetical protein
MKEIDRVVRDERTGQEWIVGFLSWQPTKDANYPDLRGRMRLGCTPASGNRVYIELSSAEARNDDAVLEQLRKKPNG